MRTTAFVLAGFASGLFSGGLGVGGAVIATPLIRFLGVAPLLAIGTTVPAILPSTITGTWTYLRSDLVDKRAASWMAGAGVLFTVIGALTTKHVDGHILMLITAAVLFVLALRLFPTPSEKNSSTDPTRHAGVFLMVGSVAGFMSGLLGVGGGFILVPALIRFLHFPTKKALGTSLAVISVIVIPNLITQNAVGNIDWRIALLLTIGVVPGARLGALLAIRAKEKRLRLAVAFGIAAVALMFAAFELTALS